MAPSPRESFAYLFERFPSFSQTFCFREVAAMREAGVACPVFSIRQPQGEPPQDYPPILRDDVTYLPESFAAEIEVDAKFRRAARRALDEMVRLWGGDSEKRRVYEALWLAPRLRARGLNHVHAHFAGMATRTAFWLKRLAGVRYSFTAHANDVFCDEPAERLDQLMAEAEWIATETEFSAKFLRDKFPRHAAKVQRIYNGIALAPLVREEPASPPLVLSVGRYIEKKGFLDLIEAAARLGDADFECWIVGQGPLEAAMNERIRALGLERKVKVVGPRSQREISSALARASAFVLACVNASDGGSDNLPTVIMEAMAAGVPVISTPVAGIPEMVIDGRTGFLVPERDPAALAERLRALLGDPSGAAKLGAAGRARCEELFASERTTADLIAGLRRAGAFAEPRRGWLSRIFHG